jgi:putative membrane protein
MTDLILAIIHHLLVFGLVAMLVAESMLVRPAMRGMDVDRVVRIDIGYGATAVLIIIVGLVRVFFGAKGYHFYANNFFFWGKIVCFLAIAGLSVPPTLQFLRWRATRKVDPAFVPTDAEASSVRKWMRYQSLVLVVLLVFAAAMARVPF